MIPVLAYITAVVAISVTAVLVSLWCLLALPVAGVLFLRWWIGTGQNPPVPGETVREIERF